MKSKLLLLAIASTLTMLPPWSLADDARASRTGPYARPSVSAGNGSDNPDWVEEPVAPPPAFSTEQLVLLDMPPQISVRVGVDPQTIAVGGDGVVRYVVVMRNASGNTSAQYEGIRCITDEVKTYARQSSSGQWSWVQAPQWKALNENMPSQHAKVFARQGGCQNRLATSKEEITKALKSARLPTQGNAAR